MSLIRKIWAGLAVTVVLDGSMNFAIEFQVLQISTIVEPVIYLPSNT
jgi:hypothetical protein